MVRLTSKGRKKLLKALRRVEAVITSDVRKSQKQHSKRKVIAANKQSKK